MWRNNIELQSEDRVNFVFNHGALGDVICSLPAVIHARRTHSERMRMLVWVPPWQMELVGYLLAPYGVFEIKDFSTFPMKKVEREGSDIGPVAINQFPFNTHTRNRVHMVDYAFGCLLDARPESMLERSYPTLALLGSRVIAKPYIVFPVGATSQNKLFKASVMGPVMHWALENGYAPVVVGTKTSYVHAESADGSITSIVMIDEADKIDALVTGSWVDMREKTTLLELRDLCGHADAVVGVDGGTLHLAGTTGVSIVYASGTTLPKHRYIARNGDPSRSIRYVGPRNLECTGCQSNMTLLFHHDFRNCVYGDSLCMDRLHPDDFVAGLKELGL